MGKDRQETKLRKEGRVDNDRDVTNYKVGTSYLDTPEEARKDQRTK